MVLDISKHILLLTATLCRLGGNANDRLVQFCVNDQTTVAFYHNIKILVYIYIVYASVKVIYLLC